MPVRGDPDNQGIFATAASGYERDHPQGAQRPTLLMPDRETPITAGADPQPSPNSRPCGTNARSRSGTTMGSRSTGDILNATVVPAANTSRSR